MADINKVNADRTPVSAGSMGNKSVNIADIASIGVMVATDVYYVARIPKGAVITDLQLLTEAGVSAATGTMDVGYMMGGVAVDDYFTSAFNSVTGGEALSSAFPLKCTDDCYITITVNTAGTIADKRVSVITGYEFKGEV